MRVVIDEYGTYVHKKRNRFVTLNNKDKALKWEFSADKVSQILIYRGAAITADAIDLAVEKGIDIIYLDRFGKPFARTYSCKFENSAAVHRCQVRAYDSEKGVRLMRGMIEAKIRNQSSLLKSLAKNREDRELEEAAEHIFSLCAGLPEGGDIDMSRNRLFGIEGNASREYFGALGTVLPEKAYAGKRTKQPPEDLFNALLSYGYGILYTEVEKACVLARLDPYMGFLHTDRPGKPSMVLDLMEEFRQPVVDRAAISLVSKKVVKPDELKAVENGFYLDRSGRHKMVEAMSTRLSKIITYRNDRHSFSSLVLRQARRVVKFICGEEEAYSPFVYGG